MSFSSSSRTSPAGKTGLALTMLTCVLLASCSANRVVTRHPAIDPMDRHPITLVEGERTIEIFAAGSGTGIGPRQETDIRAFAAEYRRSGHGAFFLAVPQNNPQARRTVETIDRALRRAGVRPVRASYPTAGDPRSVAPVKLTFGRLQAQVGSTCGQWPTDLNGNGGTMRSLYNLPYENFGCSSQQMMAAQVADPLDLVRARPESAPEVARSVNVILKYGQGTPTAVTYQAPKTLGTI